MRGPELRLLVRSLRTNHHEKLSIRKHLASLTSRQESEAHKISPENESPLGEEPHGQNESDSKLI